MTELFRPTDVSQAVALLQSNPGVALISGGTALLHNLRSGRQTCTAWVSTDALGLDQIEVGTDGLYIGAAVPMTQIAASPLLREAPYCLLTDALQQAASWQIRNVATLGGCIASHIPSADPVCALLALNAEVLWQDASGAHRAPLEALVGSCACALSRESVLTQVFLPKSDNCKHLCVFRKATVRKAFSWPLVNLAAKLSLNADGSVNNAVIAVGGMAKTTILLKNTAEALRGKCTAQLDAQEIAAICASEVSPSDSLQGSAEYKRVLCRNYLLELLEVLTGTEVTHES